MKKTPFGVFAHTVRSAKPTISLMFYLNVQCDFIGVRNHAYIISHPQEAVKMVKRYFLGIDTGTDSIGYAAVAPEYSLLKFKGEPVWGVSLFDEAALGDERRSHRTDRRRLNRRQQRVQLIQELFAHAVAAVDPAFYHRQSVSSRLSGDSGEEYTLFHDPDYTDKEYHTQYPTIHHLLWELMTSVEPHDVRLVYLACAWLVAHRGHFLSHVDTEHIAEITDFSVVWSQLQEYFSANAYAVPWKAGIESELAGILCGHGGIRMREKAVCAVLFENGKIPSSDDEVFPFDAGEIVRFLCGGNTNLKKLFCEHGEQYEALPSVDPTKDPDELEPVLAELEEADAEMIRRLLTISDWIALERLLNAGSTTAEDGSSTERLSISRAKIRVYEQHKKDLGNLKRIVKKYVPQKYGDVFGDDGSAKTKNYTAYSYHLNGVNIEKKATQEEFCKYVAGVLKGIDPEDADRELFQDILDRCAEHTFMPKQKSTDNRTIPYQLYWYELDLILKNAETYLPFLTEKDDSELTVSDKIRSVFSFRIPYYVGPLYKVPGNHAWIERKADGKIYPWNFSEKVDLDRSEEEFIRRMTAKCTYLPGKDVLPKESLLYHRFTVLNELNKLCIDGKPISVEQKQQIYRDVFLAYPKVTIKRLKDYLVSHGWMAKGGEISGLNDQIPFNLKPQRDFRRLLDSGRLTQEDAEQIILRITCTEDTARLVKWLGENFPDLPENDIRYLSRLKYKDFGRLSREFLDGICGVDEKSGTGEAFTIISALWNTNCNLMELLSSRFTFRKEMEQVQRDFWREHPQSLNERLDEMYISNAVRRPIIRTLEIVKEVTKAVGCPPEKIFVEMTRGDQPEKKGKRTESRREQIQRYYRTLSEEDVRELNGQLNNKTDNELQSDRLFLYFMQLGKCMYTETPINLDQIKGSTYNIEHIYPQKLVKDDSILNNEVLVLSEVNGQKSDQFPINVSIRSKRTPFWLMLKENGLITAEKFKRLTRDTPFSADEKWGFINRQLTETSQSTKAIAALLGERYPDTKIVYVKARLASEFRQEFDMIKSRLYNDLHHAKDAYLNVVVGNVYNSRFTEQWFRMNSDSDYSVKMKPLFTKPLVCGGETVWDGETMLGRVRDTMRKNNAHMTVYPFLRKGGLFDQQPLKKVPGLIPLKQGLPTEVYGGYNKPAISSFLLVRYTAGKKSEVMFVPLRLIYERQYASGDIDAIEAYVRQQILEITGKSPSSVSLPLGLRLIRINTVLSLDGLRVCIVNGQNAGQLIGLRVFTPFSLSPEWEIYIRRLERLCEKLNDNGNFRFDTIYDKVSNEKNIELFGLYQKKLTDSIYQRRPSTPVETLKKGEAIFKHLTEIDQAKVLLSIHSMFGRLSGGCDLTLIGGVKNAGVTRLSSSLSNWKKYYSDVRIIDQSPAGLWEKWSCNLLDLI